MLEIVNYNVDEYEFPSLLVLGCFDGLHAGHVELLKKAKLKAKINGLDLGVMMFENGKGGRLLYTFAERLRLLEEFNVKFVLKIHYDEQLKNTPAAEFIKKIDEKINIKGLMSGSDFRFGAGAKGKVSTLKSFAEDEDNGVWYLPVKDISFNDQKISSSLIKSMLESGDIEGANGLLTRNYSVTGTVADGAKRGKKILGFPTMNVVYPEDKVEVKQGVYAVSCTINGVRYGGMANYGPRPTFGEDKPVLEVFLDGYEGENYGEEVTVEFISYLREIHKFDSAEDLAARLAKDLEEAKALFEKSCQSGGIV